MDPWSIVRGVNTGLRALGVGTGPIGVLVSGPVGIAITATYAIKKWVDSENVKVFDLVRKREGCSHISMLEGSPPTPSALLYVADHGGVAWRTAGASLYFWHVESTFKPLVFSDALVPGSKGVKLVQSNKAFTSAVLRPSSGYGCSECRKIGQLKQ